MTSIDSNPPRHGCAALVFIAITVGLDMVAQSISFPILPRLTQELLGGDLPAAARWVGILEVGWAVPMFLAAPVLGLLSDRFGRRPVIILSVFGVGAELVMGALAPNVWWLLAARVLCGLTCGAQAAAMAYVADVTPPEGRTRAFGWLNAALWSGIVVGPALGGLLAIHNLRAPFWAAAAFGLANGIYGLLVLPESLPKADRAQRLDWSKASPLAAVHLLARRPGLPLLAVVLLLIWLAFQAKDNMLVLYTAYRYGWTPLTFGLFATVLALASIGVQAGLAGRVARRLGDGRAVVVGLALEVVGLLVMGLAPTSALFWASNLPIVLGGVATPALQSLISSRVGADEQGRLQGALGSISSLTSITAPLVFAQVFAWSVAPGRGGGWSGATILAGGALSLAALVLLAFRRRTDPT
jgi:DHA1 family tetracycline resistance protein-like MFS transporter